MSSTGSNEQAVESKTTYCEAIQKVLPSDAALVDDNGDGVWEPGEKARLELTLTNTGTDADARALTAYPAIRLTFDETLLGVVGGWSPEEHILVFPDTLQPGVPRRVHVAFQALSTAAPGSTTTISVAMADNRYPFNHCSSDGPPTCVDVTIGAAL
jgi:hypothetical protein